MATEIVQAKSLKEQLKIVKKFIQVAAGTASIPHTTAVKELTRPFFERALECLALSNFNSFMEILSGLNNSSVQRLKNLWEVCRHCFLRCTFECSLLLFIDRQNLSTKYETKFSELEAMMGTKQNFRQYRQELNSRPLPAFPYFGMKAMPGQ